MNATLSELMEFAMNDKVGARISSAVSRFGYPGAKSLAGRLCMWLRDKGRPSVSASRLSRRVSGDMSEFIRIVPGLAQLVSVTDLVLSFNAEIPLSEQHGLAREAFETFKPQVSVTYIIHPPSGIPPK